MFCNEDTYAFGWMNDKPQIQELIGEHKEELAGAAAYHFNIPEIQAETIGEEKAAGVLKLYDDTYFEKMYINLMYK